MAVSWDSNSISTLFSSLPSSGNGFFGTGSSTSNSMLSDYYSIKNGSYGKLMKSYYAQNNVTSDATKSTNKTKKTDNTNTSNNTATKKATIAKDVKSAADSLKSATVAMQDSDLYAKVTSTDKEGNKTEAVDTAKVFKAASDFVDSYNNMIDKASKSDTSAVKSNISAMNNYTRVNSKALSEIGITIGDDNKLSIDVEKFKNANMDDVKAVFNGRGSLGNQVSALSSAVSAVANNTFATGYTSTGNYSSASVSSYFDAV